MDIVRINPNSYNGMEARTTYAYSPTIGIGVTDPRYNAECTFRGKNHLFKNASKVSVYFKTSSVIAHSNDPLQDTIQQPYIRVWFDRQSGIHFVETSRVYDNSTYKIDITDKAEIQKLFDSTDDIVISLQAEAGALVSTPAQRHEVGYASVTVTEIYIVYEGMSEGKAYVNTLEPANITSTTGQSLKFTWTLDTLIGSVTQYNYRIELSKDNANWQVLSESLSSVMEYTAQPQSILQGIWYWRVRCTTSIGQTDWSTPKQFKLTGTPYISNIIVNGTHWEKAIEVNWRSEYQSGYELECYENNVLKNTLIGSAEKVIFIPIGTFLSKDNCSIRLRIYNEIEGIKIYSDWQEKNLSLQDIVPTVENLVISGSNIDLDLVLSWISEDQDKYQVQILKGDTLLKEYSGLLEKQIPITHNTLTIGLHKFKVRVGYKEKWTDWKEINVTLVETRPSIGILEPDSVIKDRDNEIKVWWTSYNQTEWELKVDDTTYTGTYQTEFIILPGTLTTDEHTLTLKVFYITEAGIRKEAYKSVKFIARGKPPIPTITSNNTFTTSRPTISWDTQDQQGFILEILDENTSIVWTTEWQNGLVTRQKVLTYLKNGKYKARIKVINKYSVESEYGVKEFTVAAVENAEIHINVSIGKNHTILSWDNSNSTFNLFYIVRNGTVIAKTTDTVFKDFTANGDLQYIIRGINKNDVFKDSNTVNCNIIISPGIVATLDYLTDMLVVGISRNEYNFEGSIEHDATVLHLTGRRDPVVIYGEHRTCIYNLTFSSRENLFKFIEMCERKTPFVYRDKRQTLYLAIPTQNYKIDVLGIEYSIQATKIDYSEAIDYD